MMQNTIKNKKRAPIICAIVVILFLAIYLGVILFPLMGAAYGEVLAVGFLFIYAIIIFAVIGGVLLALRERLHEIEGGEEEDAKKY